ncbi:MFS transporter [Humitalea sp. 24SJ18S-53]|uniref:MFS transporter n=1 Tax=Humitalea sp. 24SJ18S-53 TaxID=3422307 RepID=UPI003D6685D5
MPARRDWLVLALLVGARALFAMQFQSVGALGPVLVGGLVADFAALGALIGAYQVAGCVVSLPGGALAARLGDRRILYAGLGLMAVGGVILAAAPGATVALGGRVVSGTGGILLNLILVKLVMDRFAGVSLPLALGWILAAWPAGIALALLLLPLLAEGLGWRGAMALLAAMAALLLLAVPAIQAGGPAPVAASSARPPNWPALLAIATGWMAFNAALILLLSFAPAMFTAQDVPPAEAGRLASLASWVATVTVVLGGWVAARVGRPILLPVLCIGVGALCCQLVAVLPSGPANTLALIGFGLFGGLAGAPLFALAAQVLPPAARVFGMGAFYTVYYLGVTFLPPLAGWARDITADPAAPIQVATACCGLAIVSLLAFAWLRSRPASEQPAPP